MSEPRHAKLDRYLRDRAGDAYRTAFRYDADGWEPIHVREDLATRELHTLLPELVERVRGTRAWVSEEEYERFGGTTATMEIHEEGVLLHVPDGENAGVLVSLDVDAARSLVGFVAECEAKLHER
ncbi:hypothetical protein [Salarchaeum japonicum]|uniref:Uncharacterized protein n=1 Tax=Salarchaeum japonicum TaxID=555573 RepID=A0AAV3T2S4_9EURY|nr:hypothetical protein [Salarchaeum japonicum]